jgi:hypothetical protein
MCQEDVSTTYGIGGCEDSDVMGVCEECLKEMKDMYKKHVTRGRFPAKYPIINVKFDYDIDENGNKEFEEPGIIFEINTKYCSITVSYATIEDNNKDSKQRWDEFISNVKNNIDDSLCFCESNGNVSLSYKNGNVYFEVEKFGAGGDGSIEIKVDVRNCMNAFDKIIEEYKRIN